MAPPSDIPNDLMVRWETDTHRSIKPARRPMTACKRCRASKIKCDGKQDCGHCANRGMPCVYSKPRASSAAVANSALAARRTSQKMQSAVAAVGGDEALAMMAQGETTLDMTPAAAPCLSANGQTYGGANNGGEGSLMQSPGAGYREDAWIETVVASMGSGPAAPYAWSPGLDMQLDLLTGDARPASVALPEYSTDAHSSLPTGSDSDGSAQFTRSSTSPNNFASASFGSTKCVCRSNLSEHVNDVNNAIISQSMEDIFHLTSEFIHSCQGVIDCKRCAIRCTDLVCLISFFQQTGSCFHYMATVDTKKQPLKIPFAGTYVTVADPRMRLMAVVEVVHQAIEALDSIGTYGKNMLSSLNPSSQLALTNLGFLESTIREFKITLNGVVAVAERSAGYSC